MQRDKIIKDLKEALGQKFKTIEIFSAPIFEDRDLPVLIIVDESDEIEQAGFNYDSHSLGVTLKIITKDYTSSSIEIKKALEILRDFKSAFNTKALNSIDRQNAQILDNDYIQSTITLNFKYNTEKFYA